jgi:gas vesicle protein
MNEEKTSTGSLVALSFIGGALLGALAVALTTPKSGPEVRDAIKGLGRRAKDGVGLLGDQAGAVWDETMVRTERSVTDLQRAVNEAAEDFRRGLREAALDLKRGVREAATDLRAGKAAPAQPATEVHNDVSLT